MSEIKVQIGKVEKGVEEKKVRVAPYLDDELHQKIRKLAYACNTTKAELALKILEMVLTRPNLVNYIQDAIYKVPVEERVYPTLINGECRY